MEFQSANVMNIPMSQIPRIYIGAQPISEGGLIQLDEKQSHYLIRVLRLEEGSKIKLLGADGEWLAEISKKDKKHTSARPTQRLRYYHEPADIWLCFAPVKHEKIDFLARRATELGVSKLCPMKTEYTQTHRINMARLHANMVEAVEQCSRMEVPELAEYQPLEVLLDEWDPERLLLFCDESGDAEPLHHIAQGLKKGTSAAICIGPEGGFSPKERALLRDKPFVKPCTLGPRILRAETAALVGLAHLAAWIGDADQPPHFVAEEE